MQSVKHELEAFRRQLEEGSLQKAYRALLGYIMGLRIHFQNNFAESTVSGLYQGYMDMTYFALFPNSLKRHNLKIAIVFNFDQFRFEAWLAGNNRKVQRQYWALLKDHPWPGYRVATPGKGVDSILEYDLAADFDLEDPDSLTSIIETKTAAFINEIETFLSEQPPLKQA